MNEDLSHQRTLTTGYNVAGRVEGVSGTAASPAFGTVLYYCPNSSTSCSTDNGNLLTAHLSIRNADQSFGYDHLNRLTSAFTPTSSSSFTTKNQLVGSNYDAAANQQRLAGCSFILDSEGRMVKSTGPRDTTYTYDGDGCRVMKQSLAPYDGVFLSEISEIVCLVFSSNHIDDSQIEVIERSGQGKFDAFLLSLGWFRSTISAPLGPASMFACVALALANATLIAGENWN